MFRPIFYVLVGIISLSAKPSLAGSHVGVSVSTPRAAVDVSVTAAGRYYYPGVARRAYRRAVVGTAAVAAAWYSPYIGYWPYYPAANYLANGSFGYWQSSNGAYGSVYTQPGMFSSYHYGPYSTGSTTLTPGYGSHTGLVNFSYSGYPGNRTWTFY